MIKITGGKLRGQVLKTPSSETTHPMGARERLALFNAVMSRRALEGAAVLDLYAGSGALGFEALSRGAQTVEFVEKSPEAGQVIWENAANLAFQTRIKLHQKPVENFLNKLSKTAQFDVILVDPPYDNFNWQEFHELSRQLKKGGVLALSHPQSFKPNTEEVVFSDLTLESTKAYAAARISLFTKN